MCCDALSSDWILPLTLSSSLLCCPVPSRIVSFLFCLVCGGMMQCEIGRAVRVVNGEEWGCVRRSLSSFLPLPCVLRYSIVGLGLCLCDRVV